MNVYAFDVDETLQCSGGKITLETMSKLRAEGHVVGICGNKHVFVNHVYGWQNYVSFINVNYNFKHVFLKYLKDIIKGADQYIFVGNETPSNSPYSDKTEALMANWDFIEADEFYDSLNGTKIRRDIE